MKNLIRLLAFAVLAAAFLAIVQRRQISGARAGVARLEATAAGQTLAVPAGTPGSPVTPEDITRLRDENRDIHKLRGDITRARQQRKDLEKLQVENARLRERINQLKANPQAAAQPFPLANKGQATPDAAVETTFWLMRQGDIDGLATLMPVAAAEFQRMPSEEKTNSIMLLRAMASSISNMEILDRKDPVPDEAQLRVRFTRRDGLDFGRDETTFLLRRTNNLWQIIGER